LVESRECLTYHFPLYLRAKRSRGDVRSGNGSDCRAGGSPSSQTTILRGRLVSHAKWNIFSNSALPSYTNSLSLRLFLDARDDTCEIEQGRHTWVDGSLMLNRTVLFFYLIPLSVAAFLATLGSASIGSLSGWGLPLQWKTGGCVQASLGLVCAAEYDNWLFFAVDAMFYLLIGYTFLYVSHRLFPSKVERVAILKPRSILFVVLTASIITLATGLLASGMFFSPGGFSGQTYGFPLAWKTTLASCPPPCIQANGTQYDRIFLGGDLLFYMTAAYGILLYTFRKPPETQLLRTHLESGKILAIMALVVIALSGLTQI
jgi:hypothetical protein